MDRKVGGSVPASLEASLSQILNPKFPAVRCCLCMDVCEQLMLLEKQVGQCKAASAAIISMVELTCELEESFLRPTNI